MYIIYSDLQVLIPESTRPVPWLILNAKNQVFDSGIHTLKLHVI
jgi:hypothetical protein